MATWDPRDTGTVTISKPVTAAGQAGQTWTLSNTAITGTISGANTWTTISPTWTNSDLTISSDWANGTNAGKLEVRGDNADVVINGKSLKCAIESIEQRLAMLSPNPELEKEWEELKRIGDEYRKVEAEIKAKMETWNKLAKQY